MVGSITDAASKDAAVGGTVTPEQDLAKSGLEPGDMLIRLLSASERAATNCSGITQGYAIPYHHLNGAPLPFYRVKVLTPEFENGVKYKQPRKTPNHLYFPPGFRDCLLKWIKDNPGCKTFVITEGEKKAAVAVKRGIPCVGLGGVDSWRSRTIVLPKDVELYSGGAKKDIRAKLPAADVSVPELATLAVGFGELIDAITQFQLVPVIVFDSDRLGTLKPDVQRAATMLAYEFRYLGVPSNRIKQIILPDLAVQDSGTNLDEGVRKTGLDDLLVAEGGEGWMRKKLKEVVNDPKAFPKHPNPKGFINVQLENRPTRKDCTQIAAVVLSELDARGLRLRDAATGQPYFYDTDSHRLLPAVLLDRGGNVLHESAFGTLLYQYFGLTGIDHRVLQVLASQFTGEEPIQEVTPKRVVSLITENEDPENPDGIAIQASDSAYFAISPDPAKPIVLKINGANGILFEQDQTEPLDVDRVLSIADELLTAGRKNGGIVEPWWRTTLADTNLGRTGTDESRLSGNSGSPSEGGVGGLSEIGKQMRSYACLLYYISPFLQRWRGLQLPVELMSGEAGSGKSSLYSLRLQILTGRPHLRNIPTDIRDWQASLANAGGLHVIDNVHFSNRDLKQRISDEICRLITEPNPTIEMRKLYTNADQVRIPVTVTFAMTAIHQPFQNADLIQRAALFESSALGKMPDGDWVQKQLEYRGGREAWVAHQMVFLHFFLARAERDWDTNFKTEHRLAHLEQTLLIASKVLGIEHEGRKVGGTIKQLQSETLIESDWTFGGLQAFVREFVAGVTERKFMASDIVEWALANQEFCENAQLTNARKLGRYLSAHRSMIHRVVGIKEIGVSGNKAQWALVPPEKLKGGA